MKDLDNRENIPKILICGLGSIGRKHLQILRKNWPQISIAVLRSGLGNNCPEDLISNHTFYDPDSALDWQPDAAIISSPACDHVRQALNLARAGIPLLIEKPLGTGKERRTDIEELLELSTKVQISIAYVFRHDPCLKHVNEQLAQGAIGKIIEADFYCGSWLPDWRKDKDYRASVSANNKLGGGALLELSHEIDIAHFLFKSLQIHSAFMHKSNILDIDVEDQVYIIANTPDDAILTIRLNFCTTPARRCIIIRGAKGEIHWDLIAGKVSTIDSNSDTALSFVSTSSLSNCYYHQLTQFLTCFTQKSSPLCSIEDAMKTYDFIQKVRHYCSAT